MLEKTNFTSIKYLFLMLTKILLPLLVFLLISCKSAEKVENPFNAETHFTIAFGSCNRQDLDNLLWDDIINANPQIWIWGGDNIYADTDDVQKLRALYNAQKNAKGYKKLRSQVEIIGSWDDHDYGLNDGGVEWSIKEASQQAFLDFMDVPDDSPRRSQEGIYTSYNYELVNVPGKIKVIVLDTRYFRTALTPDPSGEKRYLHNEYGDGTVLGKTQWEWLEQELKNSPADFNIIVSSIQFLSDQHGFEAWGNFPHEVDRMKQLIVESRAKGVFILSGDRHISEFSKTNLEGLPYPLIDFTSSGLTNAYNKFSGEPNPYRLGEVVFTESFGILKFNMTAKKIRFQIIGNGGKVLGEIEQQY